MVHPYLARRRSEPVSYFDPRLEPVLDATLGVPLFQETNAQDRDDHGVFSGNEAEELRRALSFSSLGGTNAKSQLEIRAAMETARASHLTNRQIFTRYIICAFTVFRNRTQSASPILAYGSAYFESASRGGILRQPAQQSADGFLHPATIVKDAYRMGSRSSRCVYAIELALRGHFG